MDKGAAREVKGREGKRTREEMVDETNNAKKPRE